MTVPGLQPEFTQQDCLLRLHTCLGEDVVLAEYLSGWEALEHGGFSLQLNALSFYHRKSGSHVVSGAGQASDKLSSLKREQEELNKVLLGISVEFDYTQSLIHNLGNSGAAADGALFSGRQKDIYYKEARRRYLIPAVLKDAMQWSIEIYLHSDTAARHLIFSAGTGYPPQR